MEKTRENGFVPARAAREEIEDAEFVTLLPAGVAAAVPPRVRERRMAGLWPGPGYWTFVGLCAGAAFWMAGGYTLATGHGGRDMRALSPLSPALRLSEVTTREGDGGVLSVGGTIRNAAATAQAAPSILMTITYRDGERRERRVTPVPALLQPGADLRFESLLPPLRGAIEKVDVSLSPA